MTDTEKRTIEPLSEATKDDAWRFTRAQIAAQLVFARVSAGLSRADVAALTGISVGRIARMESGEFPRGLKIYSDIAAACSTRMVIRTERLGLPDRKAEGTPCGDGRAGESAGVPSGSPE